MPPGNKPTEYRCTGAVYVASSQHTWRVRRTGTAPARLSHCIDPSDHK